MTLQDALTVKRYTRPCHTVIQTESARVIQQHAVDSMATKDKRSANMLHNHPEAVAAFLRTGSGQGYTI